MRVAAILTVASFGTLSGGDFDFLAQPPSS